MDSALKALFTNSNTEIDDEARLDRFLAFAHEAPLHSGYQSVNKGMHKGSLRQARCAAAEYLATAADEAGVDLSGSASGAVLAAGDLCKVLSKRLELLDDDSDADDDSDEAQTAVTESLVAKLRA